MHLVKFRNLYLAVSLFCCLLILSCGTPQRGGIFSNRRSAHDIYSKSITDAGLHVTQMGALWLSAADRSLDRPLDINLPYKETGYFPADKPGALGYRFSAKRGELINISITTMPAAGVKIFTELWQVGDAGTSPGFLADIDTVKKNIGFETEKEGAYIVRVQPELLKGVEYNLQISTSASLAFPVHASGNPKMSSFWGADRDGGSRKHEGIDIVAKFRTPALAAANGQITRVQEGGLGGKVVYLRPEGRSYNLYYAHLDTQSVRSGQQVSAGDIIGLVGNTGNAERTVPHLHFGIYTSSGAVDPLPFVNKDRANPGKITAPTEHLQDLMRTGTATNIYSSPDIKSRVLIKAEAGQVVRPLAATLNFYKIILPDGNEGFIPAAQVTAKALRKQKLSITTRLLDSPLTSGASKSLITAGEVVEIMGTHDRYYLVNYKELTGWIEK